MRNKEYDYLIVGAGLFGAVFAHQAKKRGKRCLVIDKRLHTGGNVHCRDVEGICVHEYGPHIFHTSDKCIWDFVNGFTPFTPFVLNTLAVYENKLFHLPFNMNTFHEMWGVNTPQEALSKLEEQRVPYMSETEPSNLEEHALRLVGRDIYETLVKGYTEKQWDKRCCELPASVLMRLPVRLTYDNNYFNDTYQGIPAGGYNRLIEGLLFGVECRLNADYFKDKTSFDSLAYHVVYTGRIDEYFSFRLGKLEYRSLRFEHEVMPIKNFQGNAIVNYTCRDVPYTRIVEHKHFVPRNNIDGCTVITREYPLGMDENKKCEPYYPVNDRRNTKLANEYRELAEWEKNVIFGGRLAEYKYMDMHQVIASALKYSALIL